MKRRSPKTLQLNPSNFRTEKAYKRVARKRNLRYYPYSLLDSDQGGKKTYSKTKHDITIINSPENLSILQNTTQVLHFFKNLERSLNRSLNIFIDMSKIKIISEDAILYLISRLNYFKVKYPGYSIQGNLPEHENCRNLVLNSRFLNYVETQIKSTPDLNEIYPIKDGIKADPDTVTEILSFVNKHVPLTELNYAKLYGPILECLANTKNHAYKYSAEYNRWWITAIPDKSNDKVHFTVLDNGLGIPKTVRKKISERVYKMGEYLKIRSSMVDNDLIISALMGDYRTKTGKEERGTGLPSIYEMTECQQAENLTIISNSAYILTGRNKTILDTKKLKSEFEGTLLSWDFIKSN